MKNKHSKKKILVPPSIEAIKAEAAERARARAREYEQINATGKDNWHYIQGDQPCGPIPLAELKAKVTDLSINPPVTLAWHEGMKDWKHVSEISHICGVSPLAETRLFNLPPAARRPGHTAEDRALARAKEFDKIGASGKDDWYYIQNDQQFGPVPLDEVIAMVADLSIAPPVTLAWHEGMDEWKPVGEISQICGVSPLAATQLFKLPGPARRPGDGID